MWQWHRAFASIIADVGVTSLLGIRRALSIETRWLATVGRDQVRQIPCAVSLPRHRKHGLRDHCSYAESERICEKVGAPHRAVV